MIMATKGKKSGIPSDESVTTPSDKALFPFPKKDRAQNILGLNQGLYFINNPYSVKADKEGIFTGELIARNADLAKELEVLRDQLMQQVPLLDISITFFQNWGFTEAGLLLHVKPKTREQVVNLVTAANNLGIKVILYIYDQYCKIMTEL